MANELRSIVPSQLRGLWILVKKFSISVDNIDSLAASAHTNGQAQAQYSSRIFRNVSLRPPSIVWSNWKSIAHTWCGDSARKSSLPAPAGRNRFRWRSRVRWSPLLAPDEWHPHDVHRPAGQPEPTVDPPPAPAHMAPGQLTDPPGQFLILDLLHR
jgi:hypothetical protein